MQQGGGTPYAAPPPEPTPFLGIEHIRPAEPASPISSRPPPTGKFDDPAAPSAAHGSFPDDDFGERGAGTGNRWPRQETLALLKIRSDMDPVFRDATLKGPLWEEVSRKLAELGYRRTAKKCKEKFENVHKYYKRTKEGRSGRQDGKSYRFFDQLEALHGAATTAATVAASITPTATSSASVPAPILAVTTPTTTSSLAPNPGNPSPAPIGIAGMASSTVPTQPDTAPPTAPPPINPPAGISFSSNTSSSSAFESEEDTEGGEGRKRKRGGGGASQKMMAFFEGLMRQVMERQEAMQQRFLEVIEKREQDRMVREEAWRRQEIARLAREHELLAQERAAAASMDTAIVAFLQKITGQTVQLPLQLPTAVQTPPPPALQPQLPQMQPQQQPPQPQQPQQQQQQPPLHQSGTEIVRHHQPPSSSELAPIPEPQETFGGASLEPPSSRWPKVEVHALISMRSSLGAKYQETGPKGPLWEEISTEMRRLGYNRSAKRCKEKWENINKYFKKVKESNKKRPEDAKTCPYFHQLEALYRQKFAGNTGGGGGPMVTQRQPPQETNPNPNPNPNPQESSGTLAIMPPPHVHPDTESKNGNNSNRDGGNAEGSGGPSNDGHRPSLFEDGSSSSGTSMKPEDIVKELMKSSQPKDEMYDYHKLEELESNNIDEDDEDDCDDGEGGKMQYRVQFQRQNVSGGGAATATGSFLAMV